MKHIQKNQEPKTFTEWKQQKKNQNKDWKNLNPPIKQVVRDSLLQEQGHLCCYCEIRITQEKCCIDHFIPRRLEDPPKSAAQSLRFDYQNLLSSCTGENEDPISRTPSHCDQLKGDQLLPISPLDADCADNFRYTEDGQILATDDPTAQVDAQKMIDILGLNIPKLQRLRKQAIRSTLQDIEILPKEDVQRLIQGLSQLDSNGQYAEFCSAVIYQLRQFII